MAATPIQTRRDKQCLSKFVQTHYVSDFDGYRGCFSYKFELKDNDPLLLKTSVHDAMGSYAGIQMFYRCDSKTSGESDRL